jgi:hypothetical protein
MDIALLGFCFSLDTPSCFLHVFEKPQFENLNCLRVDIY